MNTNFKKALLAGTAIVAVGAFAIQAQAADITLSGPAVWGTVANGMVATPNSGDNVIMTTNNLKFDNTETGVTTAGDITATTGDLTVDTTGNTGNTVFTIGSFAGSSTADITVDNLLASTTRSVTLGFTHDVSTAGNVIIRNTETDASTTAVAVTVGGDMTVSGGGTTAITTTGTGQTATTAALTLNGATNNFSGAVTVTGGASSATNTATLTVSGASTTFTGGLALTNGAAGHAILVLNGAAAQTVTGVISSTGDINVTNTSAAGVTFVGNSTNTGALLVNNDTHNQKVTFSGNVASAITLGDNTGADTVTADFNGTNQAVSGTIAGGGTTISNLNFKGGSTITLTGAVSAIDNTVVSANTTATTNQNFASTNITVDSGSRLTTTGNAITATSLLNNGTLRLNGGTGVNATITGTGLLDVDATAQFTGALTQGTADIAAVTLTQTAASGYTVGTTNFSGAGTLALLGGTQTVTGNFTNTTPGQGTITVSNVAGTTTIVGNVGESATDELLAFNILGATAQTVTTTGNIFAATMAVNNADTLQFLGNSAQTVSSDITGGIVTIGNGTTTSDVTFSGALAGLASVTTSAGTDVRFNDNATTTGTFTNNATATTSVAIGKTLTADVLTDTGSYVLDANDANNTLAVGDFGHLADSGANGTLTGTTADRLFINVTGQLAAGTGIQLLTGINAGAATLQDNSAQYSFVTVNAGGNTNVTVNRATIESLSDSDSNDGVGKKLDSLVNTTDAKLNLVLDNVAKADSKKDVNDVLEATHSTVNGGNVVAAVNASSEVGQITSTRLAMLRDGSETPTGMAAGTQGDGMGWWIQGFGTHANQDDKDGISGYDADTWGAALGVDTQNLVEKGTLGLALSYANTNVDSDDTASAETDIDSWQATVYGDYDIDDRTYVAGQLGYVWGDNDTTRHNVGGVSGLTANGSFNSEQFTARAEVGRDFMQGSDMGGMKLTPKLLADYTNYSSDDYTETGAGGANLRVSDDTLNMFNVGVGVNASWMVKHANGAYCEPDLHAAVRYNLSDDNIAASNTFTGGGTAFSTDGLEPGRTTFNVGAGLTYHATTNWDLKAEYDFEAKEDYTAHSGLIKAGYKF